MIELPEAVYRDLMPPRWQVVQNESARGLELALIDDELGLDIGYIRLGHISESALNLSTRYRGVSLEAIRKRIKLAVFALAEFPERYKQA